MCVPTDDELHPLWASVGPFYDCVAALHQLGGISLFELGERSARHQVLQVVTGDGTYMFPAWQFDGDGGVHAALVPVFAALAGLDPWLVAVWLSNPHLGLDGLTPREVLSDDAGDSGLVAALAAQDRFTLKA